MRPFPLLALLLAVSPACLPAAALAMPREGTDPPPDSAYPGTPSSPGNGQPDGGGDAGGGAGDGRGRAIVRDHRARGGSAPGEGAGPSRGGLDGRAEDAVRAAGAAEGGANDLAMKAAVNLQLGDAPTACRFARAALKREPANRKALDIEGKACRVETPDPARRTAMTGPAPAPRDPGAAADAGPAALLRAGAQGGAVAETPPDAPAPPQRALAAQAALSRGEDREALALAEEGLRESPKDADLLYAKALALHKLNLPKDALEILEKVLAQRPGDADVHALKAAALGALGDRDGMVQSLRAAAGIDPRTYEDLLRALAKGNAVSLFGKPVVIKEERSLGPAAWVLGAAGIGFVLMLLLALALRAAPSRPAAAGPDAGPAPPLAPGVLVAGQYRVQGELGRGGMGVVWAALDEKLQRPVALKQLQDELRESDSDLDRFLKEARLVAQLKHPQIAAIYNVVEHGEDVLLVFERVEGATLAKSLLGGNSLTPEQAGRLLAQVAAALEHAHAHGIVHRDLKPSNVMIAPDGAVKVMDFGIAHRSSDGRAGTTSTAAAGTPAYMAPEQALGSVSKASDLYALGVMTYEMLCGVRPFDGEAAAEAKLKKRFLPITSRRILPAGLDVFFDAALDPDPAKRPASAADFADSFNKALG